MKTNPSSTAGFAGKERPGLSSMRRTPLKSIRDKCLDCCCYQPKEVRLCTAKDCPLWLYRMGKRPAADKTENV